jgi:ADP-ribose pyrophosphatase YjhB (NUDIX family)
MRDVTIVFLIKEKRGKAEKVLLAMKKRGFGEGFWNGYGGKFDPEKDKNLLESAVREVREESTVNIIDPKKVAEIEFEFADNEAWNQKAHVYLAREWEGEIRETEEMRPKWFSVDKIPYEKMWVDDIIWLPRILKGESLKARFVFKGEKEILEEDVQPASYK